MIFENTLADYSGSGLGNTDFIKRFAAQSTIPEAHLRAMYNSAVSASIWNKIGGVAVFGGSSQATQKLVFNQKPYGIPFDEITFTGNGSGANGWTPADGVYGTLPYSVPAGNQNNLSFGVYNNTSEVTPAASSFRIMLELIYNVAPSNARITLARNYQDTVFSPLGRIGNFTSSDQTFPASGTTDVTKKGLLQVVKEGSNLRLIDNGVTVTTNTGASQVVPGGGTRKMRIGVGVNSANDPTSISSSRARQALVYWGTLTMAEAVTWNTIVNTFLTAIGRNA